MRLFDIGMPVLTFVGTGIFFPLFQNLQKVSATNSECNVAKQCASASRLILTRFHLDLHLPSAFFYALLTVTVQTM